MHDAMSNYFSLQHEPFKTDSKQNYTVGMWGSIPLGMHPKSMHSLGLRRPSVKLLISIDKLVFDSN